MLNDIDRKRLSVSLPYSHCATFSEGSPGLNPYNGLLSWDNMASYLVVFCQMTMSNWSYMMYQNRFVDCVVHLLKTLEVRPHTI